MKIALAQLNYHIGNFASNVDKIISSIKAAQKAEAELIVFSELAVCGYPPRDFLQFNDFIKLCEEAIQKIASHCTGIAAIVGAPSRNPGSQGKQLFNSAYFIADGKVQKIVNKALLPGYDVFDEYRYFEEGTEFGIIEYKNKRIALTICEDLWDEFTTREDGKNTSSGQDTEKIIKLYSSCPMDVLGQQQPDIAINIAASPFSYTHAEERKTVLTRNARKYNVPLIYVNQVGANTELIFDGGSMVVNAEGEVIKELNYFEEDFFIVDSFVRKAPTQGEPTKETYIQRIHNALVLGIRDYFSKLGFNKAILGLSGGIDSAVVLCLAEKALGKENVRAILMPSQYSSEHSISDAVALTNNLGVQHDIIAIKDIFESFHTALKPQFKDLPFSLAEENIQARSRGVLLMGLANKFNYVLLNTSNKSELAVGYGTLYGDMCGGLSVIGDVFKTQVYELARYINREKEIIPVNTIVKPPSAELRPDQKDSDSLPEYDILDEILIEYIEHFKGPDELIKAGYDEALVKRILRLVNINEYKRYQSPPVLRVSGKSFGQGRRLPIVGKYLS